MRKTIFSAFAFLAVMTITSNVLVAQTDKADAEYDKNIALMRKDLRSDKKQFIALNMPLTDVEATKFWPVYDQYTAELSKIYDGRAALVKDYAANSKTLTDAAAADLIQKSLDNDTAITKLRQKYAPIIGTVLPGKKAALFFQLEKRLGLIMDLQIASEIPLVTQ